MRKEESEWEVFLLLILVLICSWWFSYLGDRNLKAEIAKLPHWECYNETIETADLVYIKGEQVCNKYAGEDNAPSAVMCIGFAGQYINQTIEKEVCEIK